MYSTADELIAALDLNGDRDVIDPSTGEAFASIPTATPEDLEDAVQRAETAQQSWGKLSHAERSDYLMKAADAVEASAEALAQLLSREQGKPLNGPNARFEVGACSAWLRATASFELEPEVLVDDDTTYSVLEYDPIGVVAAINPWNWPMMIAIWQIAPALRMGNTVVTKPASSTTLSVLALAHVLNEVLPADVLIALPADSKVGAALTSHPKIGKVMFTGSTEVGHIIARDAAENLARVTLELGGNDAGIVLPDIDPKAMAEGIFWGAFINTGQTCAALKRLYVPAEIYDETVAALVEFAKQMPMGNGLEEQNVLGPLQNRAQFDVVDELVKAAVASGATVNLGGDPDYDAPGFFYPTTLVSNIDNDNPLVAEEQFGPALPIIKYDTIEQAIEWANGVSVGLGSSVWSNNRDEALNVARQLTAGTTWINQHGAVDPRIPFGGAKQSGYGLEFGVAGLKGLGQPHVYSMPK